MGKIPDWIEMLNFYPFEKIIETINWTKQLEKREKDFARLFIQSDLLNAA